MTLEVSKLDWSRINACLDDRDRVGEIGQQCFIQLFGGVPFADKYEERGDVQLDGKVVEIKTQNCYHWGRRMLEYMTVKYKHAEDAPNPTKNFLKCVHVDRLVFVEYTANSDYNRRMQKSILPRIRVWECTDRKTRGIRYTTKDRLFMAGWPIDNMKLLHEEINPEMAALFHRYSQCDKDTPMPASF